MFVFMGILVISIGTNWNKIVTFNCHLARLTLFSYGRTKKVVLFFFVYSSVRPSITLTGETESGIHHTTFKTYIQPSHVILISNYYDTYDEIESIMNQ